MEFQNGVKVEVKKAVLKLYFMKIQTLPLTTNVYISKRKMRRSSK